MANEFSNVVSVDAPRFVGEVEEFNNPMSKLSEIPIEKESEYFFVFPDDNNSKIPVPESWKRLCGFIQDFPILDKNIPLVGYFAEDIQLMKNILQEYRVTNPDEYLKALNGKVVEVETTVAPECLNAANDQNRIRAANLSDFLSISLVKRIILSWFAESIMNTSPDNVDKITSMLGSRPLDIDDIHQFGLENERSLWEVYPREYERIFGQKLDKSSTSQSSSDDS